MFVDKNSIIIDNINMGKYLTSAKFGYNKIWSSDTGRDNLAGTQQGTLIGIFPKLELSYKSLSPSEVHTLASIFDKAQQTTQYYDDNKGAMVTMSTYTGDWSIESENMQNGKPFSISFIARKRRT